MHKVHLREGDAAIADTNPDVSGTPQSFFDLLENASDAIYFHDPRGKLVFLNKKAEDLTGYKRKDLANKNISTILDAQGKRLVRETLKLGLNAGCDVKLEVNIRCRSGEKIPVEISMTPIVRNKRLAGFEGIARDIRARRLSESQFQEKNARIHQLNVEIQKMNMKLEETAQIQSEFVSHVSHDFRTPLNGIIGYAELLEDKVYGDMNANQLAALENIKACASDLLKMVQEILDLSRQKTNQLRLHYEACAPGDLIEATSGTVAPIAVLKGLQFEARAQANLPAVQADFKRIYQVLVNLAVNAVKFTANGKIEIGASRTDTHIRFHVTDSGIGISDELQTLIFRNATGDDGRVNRYRGGLGLGLSLSKRLVEMHGGTMWLRSQENRGSSFFFTLPLQES